MRILTITHNYPRWDGDRAGAFVARLAAETVALGHSVRVVAPHAPHAALRETQHGVEIVRARYGPDALERVGYTGALRDPMRATMLAPLMLPPFLARLWSVSAREAREFRPDVVHAHWWMPGGWIARRIGLPYIVTSHGTDVRMLESPHWRTLAAPVFARASAVTTASTFLARDVVRFFPGLADKTSVTQMPMDLEMFEQGARAEKVSPPRVLYAGNLIASKGVDVLIEAIARLRDSRRGVPAAHYRLRSRGDSPAGACGGARARRFALVVTLRVAARAPERARRRHRDGARVAGTGGGARARIGRGAHGRERRGRNGRRRNSGGRH